MRPIYIYGSPVLRQVAQDITPEYPNLPELIKEMQQAMAGSDGVGLAAPQIGLSIRLFVVDATPFADKEPQLADFRKVFINPNITDRFGSDTHFTEGCLSIPGIHEDVVRPSSIRMQWVDENFNPHQEEFSGMAARIIQHEYDHLEGILFIDHLSPLRKRMLQSKLKNMQRGRYKADYPCRLG